MVSEHCIAIAQLRYQLGVRFEFSDSDTPAIESALMRVPQRQCVLPPVAQAPSFRVNIHEALPRCNPEIEPQQAGRESRSSVRGPSWGKPSLCGAGSLRHELDGSAVALPEIAGDTRSDQIQSIITPAQCAR